MEKWELHQWIIIYEHPEEPETIKAILDAALKKCSHRFTRSPYEGEILERREGELVKVDVVPWMDNTLRIRYASANGSSMLGALEELLGEGPDYTDSYSWDVLLNMF